MTPRRILLLCGSLRSGSTNEAALRTIEVVAPDGVTAVHFPGLAELPPFNPDDDRDPLHPAVVELRRAIADADAVLISTPEYAGDLPGTFKNLLDWTVGGVEICDKPTGWINASAGGADGARHTYDSLRRVLTFTGAAIVDDACAHIPVPRHVVGPDRTVTAPGARARLAALARSLLASVETSEIGGAAMG